MLRLRVLLLLTSLDKCCGVGLFSSNNGSFFGRYIRVSSGVGIFSSNNGGFFGGDIWVSSFGGDLFSKE